MFFKDFLTQNINKKKHILMGNLKLNFFPYNYKSIDFCCKQKLHLIKKGVVPMKIFSNNTSIMREVKKDSLRTVTGMTIKQFSLFGFDFAETFKIVPESKKIISIELIEKNIDTDLAILDLLMTTAIFAFAFNDVANSVEYNFLNSNSGSETSIQMTFTVTDEVAKIIFKNQEDNSDVEVKMSKAEVELAIIKASSINGVMPVSGPHCNNCEYSQNCF